MPSCGNGVVEGDEACDDGAKSATCNADCTVAVCGDGHLNTEAGEVCDDTGESDICDDDCTLVECGDSTTNASAGEECDDGGLSPSCDDDCTFAACGDGVYNPNAGELCDEGPDSPTCDPDCTSVECGDGTVNMAAGETCDEMMETITCDADCSAAECGDGFTNLTAEEECDDAGESMTCDSDCTLASCGDGQLNVSAGETCDEGGMTMTCDNDCTDPACGDGLVNGFAGEQCDDGNMTPDDGCTNCTFDPGVGQCAPGFDLLSTNPSGNMVVCDDPTNTTCEEDMEMLCTGGWGLCTRLQHINRNDTWNYPVGGGGSVVVGEISCRGGGAAGHYTLGPYDGVTNLMDDPPLNCGYGSSRDSCPSGFGCNELTVETLCCAPTPSCGNGVVDSVEEECDDGNLDEADDCLNSCSWRIPTANGVGGVGC